MALLRVVLIPLTMLCNINSRRIPTVFYHDSIPTILVGLLGLTNGYLIALSVNYAPRCVFILFGHFVQGIIAVLS